MMETLVRTCCAWAPSLDHVDQVRICVDFATQVSNASREEELRLLSKVAAGHAVRHWEYSVLAARVQVLHLHETTRVTFSRFVGDMREILSVELVETVERHAARIDAAVDDTRDHAFDAIGLATLMRSYLLRRDGVIVERPQYMYMRVALGIHGTDVDAALETYALMSQRYFTHATPTMFNAGTRHPQLASCFLLTMKEDSIAGIYDTLKQCASISKHAGGIGLSVSSIRARGTPIAGTMGVSNGLVPMLKVFNATAAYVDQGGGKRKGGFAMYVEPWHGDVEAFLDLKKNHGVESDRARDLFYALWVPDLFMERVQADASWSLMCPHEVPELLETHGDAWREAYEAAERAGRVIKTVSARRLWHKIVDAQMETGMPYMMYKDACNAKSNQQHLGVLKGSNLCAEVVEYTSPEECAVCTLASVALPACVRGGVFDFDMLARVVRVVVRNLDKVIDVNYYPVKEARVSNMRHRPIGIGVNGLHDVFYKMRYPWESQEALDLNRDMFETMYHAAVSESCALAEQHGAHPSHAGSPMSQGKFQFDLWGVTPTARYDWDALRARVARHGMRHALLLSCMPCASSGTIIGNSEGIDPRNSNLYVRRILSGEYVVMNKYLINDLVARDLWHEDMQQLLVAAQGSVQKLPLPSSLKRLYKTAFEVSQKSTLDLSIGRGPYICQSQSLNLWWQQVSRKKLTMAHLHAWRGGLKTSQYYCRTKSKVDAVAVTVDPTVLAALRTESDCKEPELEVVAQDECLMCSA